MADFDKTLSTPFLPELAQFDLDVNALEDNQSKINIISSDGLPIQHNNRYILNLDIKFGYIRRLAGGENYDFGIKKAMIQIICAGGCKMPWKKQELIPKLAITSETKEENQTSTKIEVSSSKGASFIVGKDSKNTENVLNFKVWMTGDEFQPQVHFIPPGINYDIIFAKETPLVLGVLEVDNPKSQLKAILSSIEVVPTQFNGQKIKRLNLGRMIQRFSSQPKIEQITRNLTGELQDVELRYVRR
jgi:hypothetical protein